MLNNFRKIDITWDKADQNIIEIIRTSSSDENGRKLVVQVLDNGQTVNLKGTELRLYWETKNKHYIGFDRFELADAENGIFELAFSTGMLSNIGTLKANMHLMNVEDETVIVTSEPFNVEVFEGIDSESIEATNSFTALTDALVRLTRIEESEETRKENEVARNESESERKQSESSRVSAEGERIANEEDRKSNEVIRKNAEDTREQNESTRKQNEDSRESAESTRESNEELRISDENERSSAEQSRETNEDERINAENTRESSEKNRENAESARKSQEDDRVSEENARVEAEDDRSDNELERRESESDRVNTEGIRQAAEGTRDSNEANRISAEQTRQSNEQSRESTFESLQQAMEAVEQDYADRAEDLELTYSPRLLDVENDLENNVHPTLSELEAGNFDNRITVKTNSMEEDSIFLRLLRADETLLGWLSTGPDGTGLKIHMADKSGIWSGYVQIDEDGTIRQNGVPVATQ